MPGVARAIMEDLKASKKNKDSACLGMKVRINPVGVLEIDRGQGWRQQECVKRDSIFSCGTQCPMFGMPDNSCSGGLNVHTLEICCAELRSCIPIIFM
jgi:hypothetical protein